MFLLFLLWSCNNSGKNDKELLDEFSFSDKKRVILPSDQSHAFAFVESDTLRIGDTYRAKLFLANRSNEYNENSLKPFFKLYHEYYNYWDDLVNKGVFIESINDTAYVKFVVQDDELIKGESKIKKWYATIFIPLQGDTTSFGLVQEYVVQRK